LLDVSYVHVVFTLPHALLPLCDRHAVLVYTLLFKASAAALLEVAADPRHLGAAIGFLSNLHTWGQTLVRHPHVHCVVPAGGFSPDRQRWIRPKYQGFFLPVKVLSRVFRGKFVEALRRAYARDELDLAGATATLRDPARWHAFINELFRTDWVVDAKPKGQSCLQRAKGCRSTRRQVRPNALESALRRPIHNQLHRRDRFFLDVVHEKPLAVVGDHVLLSATGNDLADVRGEQRLGIAGFDCQIPELDRYGHQSRI
jgi:hypothetical protein